MPTTLNQRSAAPPSYVAAFITSIGERDVFIGVSEKSVWPIIAMEARGFPPMSSSHQAPRPDSAVKCLEAFTNES